MCIAMQLSQEVGSHLGLSGLKAHILSASSKFAVLHTPIFLCLYEIPFKYSRL